MIPLDVAPEVAEAIDAGRPVVALESSLIAQGLPAPHNLEAAAGAEAAVRDAGAVPATVALADHRVVIGANSELLARLADTAADVRKVAAADIAPVLAGGQLGATTVSATLRLAALAGIRVFATGGIGGVHPGASATFDVSADLDELAATRMIVVSSGAKSLLDLRATLEVLESRRVPVVGIGTSELPAFYASSSGLSLAHRVDSPADAAAMGRVQLEIPGSAAILFVQPPPAESALDADELRQLIERATEDVARDGVTGARVTPAVLGRLAVLTDGRTLRTNVSLILNNARVAARIAVALASPAKHS